MEARSIRKLHSEKSPIKECPNEQILNNEKVRRSFQRSDNFTPETMHRHRQLLKGKIFARNEQ